MAMHFPGERDAGHFKEGGDQVGPAHRGVTDRLGWESLGHGDDQGAADRGVVGGDLGTKAMLAPGKPLVRGEDDQGVFILTGFLECFKELFVFNLGKNYFENCLEKNILWLYLFQGMQNNTLMQFYFKKQVWVKW